MAASIAFVLALQNQQVNPLVSMTKCNKQVLEQVQERSCKLAPCLKGSSKPQGWGAEFLNELKALLFILYEGSVEPRFQNWFDRLIF